jgi:hypothetical protein
LHSCRFRSDDPAQPQPQPRLHKRTHRTRK